MKVWKVTEHRELIAELIRLFEYETYVELGIRKAQTFNMIAPLVKRAVAVDNVDWGRIIDRPNVEKFIMTSEEFSKVWKDPIDLLFIDADHAKQAVLSDVDRISPFVREGTGLILLHDTYPIAEHLLAPGYCNNAWEAAWTIRRSPKYKDFEIVTLPGPYAGLSIIRKAPRHLCWR